MGKYLFLYACQVGLITTSGRVGQIDRFRVRLEFLAENFYAPFRALTIVKVRLSNLIQQGNP